MKIIINIFSSKNDINYFKNKFYFKNNTDGLNFFSTYNYKTEEREIHKTQELFYNLEEIYERFVPPSIICI